MPMTDDEVRRLHEKAEAYADGQAPRYSAVWVAAKRGYITVANWRDQHKEETP